MRDHQDQHHLRRRAPRGPRTTSGATSDHAACAGRRIRTRRLIATPTFATPSGGATGHQIDSDRSGLSAAHCDEPDSRHVSRRVRSRLLRPRAVSYVDRDANERHHNHGQSAGAVEVCGITSWCSGAHRARLGGVHRCRDGQPAGGHRVGCQLVWNRVWTLHARRPPTSGRRLARQRGPIAHGGGDATSRWSENARLWGGMSVVEAPVEDAAWRLSVVYASADAGRDGLVGPRPTRSAGLRSLG
jgi:hypothetical protein